MPIFAVAAAVVAIGIAAEVGTTLAIIAAVGATIGAVGAVTGSKELMIAGGVIGAIGGIGALAQSAGIFGSAAAGIGGSLSGAGAGVGQALSGAASGIDAEIGQWASYGAGGATGAGNGLGEALSGAPTLGGAAPSVSTNLDVVDTVTGNVNTATEPLGSVASNAGSPDVNPAAASDAGGVPNTQMAGQESVDASGKVIQGDTGAASVPGAPQAPGAAPGTVPNTPTGATNDILAGGQGVTGAPQAGTTVTGAPSAAATPPGLINSGAGGALSGTAKGGAGIFGQIMDVIGKPGVGTLAAGVVQAGMSFLSGATNGLTPAQINALNAQAEANQAAANMSRLQQANMSGALPVASRTPLVRSPPVTGTPAPVGLINTPPQGAPA